MTVLPKTSQRFIQVYNNIQQLATLTARAAADAGRQQAVPPPTTSAVARAIEKVRFPAIHRMLTLFPIRGTEDVDVFNERPMFRAHLYEAKRRPITVAK